MALAGVWVGQSRCDPHLDPLALSLFRPIGGLPRLRRGVLMSPLTRMILSRSRWVLQQGGPMRYSLGVLSMSPDKADWE